MVTIEVNPEVFDTLVNKIIAKGNKAYNKYVQFNKHLGFYIKPSEDFIITVNKKYR